ncbi:hypothetical protein AALO_G00154210 [Alosa alosa]|uniref:Uncharacterized protein n=1 Tax=Alosa alosa TaxID=278164 RepID=A0AAV6GIP4_9TELE|nr:uncharacterized protein LOC125303896 [Alosa alosa]KAG5273676.1 hypothetical protein AALO_G00154210 [Alosa alosa]
MQFCWFLACCLAARQDEGKKIKKCVKKYGLVELKRELEALGVNIDGHWDETKKKNKKKIKKELQKLLIKELKKIEHDKKRLDNRAYEDGFTMPMDIPEHVLSALNELEALRIYSDEDMDETTKKNKMKRKIELQRFLINELKEAEHGKTDLDNQVYEEKSLITMPVDIPEDVLNVLDDLDTFLDKQLEVSERYEREDAVLDSLLFKVVSTLEREMKRKRNREHGGQTLETGKRRRNGRPVSGVPYKFTIAPSLGGGFVW